MGSWRPFEYRAMNVSRKSDRAEMARRLEEAAKAHGVPYIREDGWNEEPRTIAVSFTLPHGLRLSVHLEGDSAQQREGTHVLSWHGVEAGWRLRPDCFEDVNSFHGHKATDICYDFWHCHNAPQRNIPPRHGRRGFHR